MLAIAAKRRTRALVTFLTRAQIDALLSAPDRTRWTGRRDHALLTLAIQTGLRVSELTAVQNADISFARGAHVRVVGKGRKERVTPLTSHTVAVLRAGVTSAAEIPPTRSFPACRTTARPRRRPPHSSSGMRMPPRTAVPHSPQNGWGSIPCDTRRR